MTIDEMIAVLQAYKEGKTIEVGFCGEWNELKEPIFDFTGKCGYRIKPEPHYRPFQSAEEVMEAIKEHGGWVRYKKGGYYKITYFADEGVQISDASVDSYKKSFEELTFIDGTPFGKLVEEYI